MRPSGYIVIFHNDCVFYGARQRRLLSTGPEGLFKNWWPVKIGKYVIVHVVRWLELFGTIAQ